jgi:hypothetical protein
MFSADVILEKQKAEEEESSVPQEWEGSQSSRDYLPGDNIYTNDVSTFTFCGLWCVWPQKWNRWLPSDKVEQNVVGVR